MFLLLVLFFNVLLHYGVPGDMLMSWMLFFLSYVCNACYKSNFPRDMNKTELN